MTNVNALLPHALDVGTKRRWFLPLPAEGGSNADDMEHMIVVATFLGMGTSHVPVHSNHEHKQFVDRGTRCNACRWFEVRIFRELLTDDPDRADDADLGGFIIHTTGCSIVPTEQSLYKYVLVSSPHSVVENLTTRRVSDNGPEAFITKPSALALAEAAGHDRSMRDAYRDRAVS